MTITSKTRNFALAGMIALVATLSGCFIETSSGPPACDATLPGLQVTWDLEDNLTGAALTCAQAGASEVDLFLNDTFYNTFACTAYGARTTRLAPGAYTVSMDLIDAADNTTVISTFDSPVAFSVGGCGLTNAGNVTFPVNF